MDFRIIDISNSLKIGTLFFFSFTYGTCCKGLIYLGISMCSGNLGSNRPILTKRKPNSAPIRPDLAGSYILVDVTGFLILFLRKGSPKLGHQQTQHPTSKQMTCPVEGWFLGRNLNTDFQRHPRRFPLQSKEVTLNMSHKVLFCKKQKRSSK